MSCYVMLCYVLYVCMYVGQLPIHVLTLGPPAWLLMVTIDMYRWTTVVCIGLHLLATGNQTRQSENSKITADIGHQWTSMDINAYLGKL